MTEFRVQAYRRALLVGTAIVKANSQDEANRLAGELDVREFDWHEEGFDGIEIDGIYEVEVA